ncbi:hypothetical protein WG947_09305 [Pontibacter sp. H259]|uniref:hypothetical protein n=1 Tax=Pontibacter sp. H259 TaxID=3133421 RepID=UPI0030BB3CF2
MIFLNLQFHMKHILPFLALLLFNLTSFAQQAAKTGDPCRDPFISLYDANQQKLPEGTLPQGKVMILVRNNPNCSKHFTFKAEKMTVYLVGGVRPLAQAQLNGNSFDFSEWQKFYKEADRILIEITEVSYTYNKGEEKGTFPGSVIKNWSFKGR